MSKCPSVQVSRVPESDVIEIPVEDSDGDADADGEIWSSDDETVSCQTY